MEVIQTLTLIAITTASVFLVVWLFRPNSAKRYKHYSKMPLMEDRKIVEKKGSGRPGNKKRKS